MTIRYLNSLITLKQLPFFLITRVILNTNGNSEIRSIFSESLQRRKGKGGSPPGAKHFFPRSFNKSPIFSRLFHEICGFLRSLDEISFFLAIDKIRVFCQSLDKKHTFTRSLDKVRRLSRSLDEMRVFCDPLKNFCVFVSFFFVSSFFL